MEEVLIVAALLMLVAVGCFRVAQWHSQESTYWYGVAARVRLLPDLEARYRPLLEWTQAHRPGVLRRALGWRSPEVRRERAGEA